jgi:hypothetical protein
MAIDIKNIKSQSRPLVSPIDTSLVNKLSGLLSKEINLWGKEMKDKKKESFYRELISVLPSTSLWMNRSQNLTGQFFSRSRLI